MGGKAQAKASATSIPQLGGFFCPLQCYGHPSVGEKARAKAGATSTSQFGCPCSYYRCPSVEREARAKAGATTTSTIGWLLFFCNASDTQVWEGRHGLKPVLYPPHIWMAFVFYRAKDTQLWDGGHWLKPVLHPSHRRVPPLQIQGRHNGHGPPPMLQLCLLPVLLCFLIMGRVLLLMGAGCSCSVRGCVRCRYW